MEACEIFAEVTVQGLVFLGEVPATGTYICAATTLNPYTTSISPYICTGMLTASQLGVAIKDSNAAQTLISNAIENSCVLAVDFAGDTMKIIALKTKETHKETRRRMTETKRTFSALNTAEGMSWLMRYMSGGY